MFEIKSIKNVNADGKNWFIYVNGPTDVTLFYVWSILPNVFFIITTIHFFLYTGLIQRKKRKSFFHTAPTFIESYSFQFLAQSTYLLTVQYSFFSLSQIEIT